jgi:pimeloyl-ACP methyl ester carboxylesterase
MTTLAQVDRYFKRSNSIFHYIDWGGSGPLAHMAHATGLCAGVYTPFAEKLRSRLNMLGMDDRGHGKTQAAANPQKLKNWNVFVADLERFFETLNGPIIAMGHSRGATASLLLAVKRPDLVRALVLIDPTIIPFAWGPLWFLAKATGLAKHIPIAATAAKRKNNWPDRSAVLTSYKEKAVFQSWVQAFLKAYVAEGTRETDQGIIKLRCEPAWESRCFAVCPHDVWGNLPQLQQPVLVVYGAKSDTFLAPAARRFQTKVPHAVLQRFEKTGHFVPMERPQETAAAIFSFLEDHKLIGDT